MGVGPARDRAARVARNTGWLAAAVVLVLVSTILGGCSDVTQPVAADLTGPRSGFCPPEYPRQLHMTRQGPAGSPPLRGLHACTSDTHRGPVLLVNGGSTVWATVAPGHPSRLVQHDARAAWLRDRVAVPPALLLPGTAVLVWARPSQVTWRPNREWSVAWASLEAGLQALRASGRDTAQAAVDANVARGQALISCTLTAYHLFQTAAVDAAPTGDGLGALELTWSSAPTACAADWSRADRLLSQRGVTPTAWVTAVNRADAWVNRARSALSWLDLPGIPAVGLRG